MKTEKQEWGGREQEGKEDRGGRKQRETKDRKSRNHDYVKYVLYIEEFHFSPVL